MAKVEVRCPYCGTNEIVKYGKEKTGVQRYKCMNKECCRKIFQLEYVIVDPIRQ
ncbi:MAG: IS1 family transposase [Ruminococcus sp.]|nr:IS1 family transposase [Ruminococcus sp.]